MTTVRVKQGRVMTIRQIERDNPQPPPQRDFSVLPRPQFAKAKKKFSAPKKHQPKASAFTEGNRVGDIKRLDARGKFTPEERVTRLVELADRFGEEYLENELQIHRRKAFELEEALARYKSARVDKGVQKLAEKIEKEINKPD